MNVKAKGSTTKPISNLNKNPLETLRDLGAGDDFFGSLDKAQESKKSEANNEVAKTANKKKEFKLFDYQQYSETTLIKKQINELTELIRKEIDMLKRENSSLLSEVRDVEKLTIDSLPEKPGIYHVRFLEVVLSMIRHLRAKVGESKTWMNALITKKKKRGSLFSSRSKNKGTQYSLSQELQSARSVQ